MDAARWRSAGPQPLPHPALARRPRPAMSRHTALLAVTLVVFAAGLVALVMRFGIGGLGVGTGDPGAPSSATEDAAQADDPIVPTSEALIAEALSVGDISYEDSL